MKCDPLMIYWFKRLPPLLAHFILKFGRLKYYVALIVANTSTPNDDYRGRRLRYEVDDSPMKRH